MKTKKSTYLMESIDEATRLLLKTNKQQTLTQLRSVGFHQLKSGCSIVDVGSGSGVVAKVMAQEIETLHKKAHLTLVDISSSRLAFARRMLKVKRGISVNFLENDAALIKLPSNSQDFVFCRFLFEYINQQQVVFDELFRICKRGGKIVVGDLDNNCLTHYPLSKELNAQLNEITVSLSAKQMFDPWAGRKIFSYFHSKKLKKINVGVFSHHLFYGKLRKSDELNWKAKLEQITRLQNQGKLSLTFDANEFSKNFLSFLRSEERFTFTPLFLVSGTK